METTDYAGEGSRPKAFALSIEQSELLPAILS